MVLLITVVAFSLEVEDRYALCREMIGSQPTNLRRVAVFPPSPNRTSTNIYSLPAFRGRLSGPCFILLSFPLMWGPGARKGGGRLAGLLGTITSCKKHDILLLSVSYFTVSGLKTKEKDATVSPQETGGRDNGVLFETIAFLFVWVRSRFRQKKGSDVENGGSGLIVSEGGSLRPDTVVGLGREKKGGLIHLEVHS